MSENNEISYIEETTNKTGTISYANDVIAIIAGLAATEIAGISGMSGGITSGIAEMLGRKNLTKGVKVEVGTEETAIDLNVIVDFFNSYSDYSRTAFMLLGGHNSPRYFFCAAIFV